jgi:hypothetical protein
MARATFLGAAMALVLAVGCGPSEPPPVRVVPKPAPSEPVPPKHPIPPEDPTPPDPPPTPPPEPPPATAVRVFYLEAVPRWEFQYLSNLLARDKSLRTWTLLLDSDPDAPPRTSPGLEPIDAHANLDLPKSLAAYDVVIVGDVEPGRLGPGPEAVTRSLTALREFVERGGGLAVIAGAKNMPSRFAGTPLEDVLPVRLDHAVEVVANARNHGDGGLAFHVTPDGETCPYIDIASDRAESKRRWESDEHWTQYWAFPVRDARPGAQVLLETSEIGGDPQRRTPVVVASAFGRGRVLYVGVDELWRMRYEVGDRWFGRFWKGAVRWLASAPR